MEAITAAGGLFAAKLDEIFGRCCTVRQVEDQHVRLLATGKALPVTEADFAVLTAVGAAAKRRMDTLAIAPVVDNPAARIYKRYADRVTPARRWSLAIKQKLRKIRGDLANELTRKLPADLAAALADASQTIRAVIRAIARLIARDRGQCDASLDTIAEMAQCSRRSASLGIEWLIERGWIVRISRRGASSVLRAKSLSFARFISGCRSRLLSWKNQQASPQLSFFDGAGQSSAQKEESNININGRALETGLWKKEGRPVWPIKNQTGSPKRNQYPAFGRSASSGTILGRAGAIRGG